MARALMQPPSLSARLTNAHHEELQSCGKSRTSVSTTVSAASGSLARRSRAQLNVACQSAGRSLQTFTGMRQGGVVDRVGVKSTDFKTHVAVSVASVSSRRGRTRGVAVAMFERFTEKAIKVIMLAQEEARRLGHNFVGTEQILLGLIGEGTGIAAKVLKSMGVNLKEARVEVEKIIGRGSGFVAVEIPFTPRAKRVLELSLEEARQLGTYTPPTYGRFCNLTFVGIVAQLLLTSDSRMPCRA